MLITCDFDETICLDEFPMANTPVPGAIEAIKELNKHHRLILFTCREGSALGLAIQFLKDHNIFHCFETINEWPEDIQIMWDNNCRKIVGDQNIDDKNAGCPLVRYEGHYVVDWDMVIGLICLRELTKHPVCGGIHE